MIRVKKRVIKKKKKHITMVDSCQKLDSRGTEGQALVSRHKEDTVPSNSNSVTTIKCFPHHSLGDALRRRWLQYRRTS